MKANQPALVLRCLRNLRMATKVATSAMPGIDMIEVRRIGEGEPLEFEVILCEGEGQTATAWRSPQRSVNS